MRLCLAFSLVFFLALLSSSSASAAERPHSSAVISIDGDGWLLAPDPTNVGRQEKWWNAPRPDAKPTKVPWIIQAVLPGYHGVAWYWRDVEMPPNPHAGGRYLLRFWMVDYLADVWVNGTHVGTHEGPEDMFTFDITDAVKPGEENRIAVRVLNPTEKPIDGIILSQTAHRNKTAPYSPGSDFNYGGITDSVELLVTPVVHIGDLFVRPDFKTGKISIQTALHNTGKSTVKQNILFSVAPANSGHTLQTAAFTRELPPGDTSIKSTLKVPDRRLWDLNDPYMYRVSVRVTSDTTGSFDEKSARCGFRDFRFADGSFRLNGRRIFLRSSHSGSDSPIGVRVPFDPDLLRRDLLNVKAMGFNMIRFISGLGRRYQLDLCDEIGLLVYEESFAGWGLGDSSQMAKRYDDSIRGMILRDRNHPSVAMWGLLNETLNGNVFRHAARALPMVREVDDSRVVMLNSGRFDLMNSGGVGELESWQGTLGNVPCVNHNPAKYEARTDGVTWKPGQMAFHPGSSGEQAVVRWTAPHSGEINISAAFKSIAVQATTDVHVLHNSRVLFDGLVNLFSHGPEAKYDDTIKAEAGDTIDCTVGFGNGSYLSDTTALALTIKYTAGKTYDAATEFTIKNNPNGSWSYGYLPPGKPDATAFKLLTKDVFSMLATKDASIELGSLSNPGSSKWEDILADEHPYRHVPHTAGIIQEFRTMNGNGKPLFISEYGIGSAIDLVRATRHYEQLGQTQCEDAQVYRRFLDSFMADWKRWNMADTFAGPADYFHRCLAKMAGQRKLGINAIRANANVVGYSMTGTQDQGLSGEGLTTTFRELKPGTVDALFDAWYPLRWCLFVEPVNVYSGSKVKLEAVLANEDVLAEGEYPVRLQVVGPDGRRMLDRTITISIPKTEKGRETPFAMPVFSEEIRVDGPTGKCRFLATFERGGAAAGGDVEFYTTDRADMPAVENEVVLWGKDEALDKWMRKNGIRVRPFAAGKQTARDVILVSGKPPQNQVEAFCDLARQIARGSTAVFLTPDTLKKDKEPTGWLPLANKGKFSAKYSWVYVADEWAKRHPIFAGLPCGDLMDYTYYREIIPNVKWLCEESPAEAVAGSINTSLGYESGLMVSVHKLGGGRFILNTLRIRDNLEVNPVAERLLRNMLRYTTNERAKPPAKLPSDFDAQLKAIGYQ